MQMSDEEKRLGWWIQLVESTVSDNNMLRDMFVDCWADTSDGNGIAEVNWPENDMMPISASVYGAVEDSPPDFDEFARAIQPYMEAGQYFVFIHALHTSLSNNGVECVVITDNAVLKLGGKFMIQKAIDVALLVQAAEKDTE